ncbi:hypothetical protein BC628DRAFT_1409853 [Trametes gibbosa]|nr:hypothetical protein BC628DRAFT_1409853 [Trametes gibbosa]
MGYVRMGLSIRDRHGRIDKERTELVRAEIRRRDEQARLRRRWEAYETRWKVLCAGDAPVAFGDIAWPIHNAPSSVQDLYPEPIVQFFQESLQVSGNVASETDILRSALLRWHPDKMSMVFSRTVSSDMDSVREGVNIVFRALHARIHCIKHEAIPS